MAASSAEEDLKKLKDITREQSVDEQGMTFLRAFVGEFQVCVYVGGKGRLNESAFFFYISVESQFFLLQFFFSR